jgi:predicted RNA methylase
MKKKIKELIRRRRRQILVHSCIYYRFGTSIVEDSTFDEWAYELVELQKNNPEISKSTLLYDEFKDFDGSTGFDLPTGEPWVVDKAYRLIKEDKVRSK